MNPWLVALVALTGLRLVLAAILSAAMSSLSSGLNSACAVLERDFLSRRAGGPLSAADSVTRMKWLTWLVTAVSVAYSKDFGLPLVISFVWMVPCSLLVGIVVGTVGSAIMPSARNAS